MKINILLIVILTLLLIDVFLLYKLINPAQVVPPNNSVEELKTKYSIELASAKDEIKLINKDCVLIDANSAPIILSELLSNQSLMILKISKLNCNSCVDYSVNLIKSFLEENAIKFGKVIILYENSNIRDQILLQKSLGTKISLYQIAHQDSLNLVMDQFNIPYFFILDSDYIPKIIHVADKRFPNFTKKYFEIVYNNFLNRNQYK